MEKQPKGISPKSTGRKERSLSEKMGARQVREAYIGSYTERWGVAPTLAAAENALVYSLIERVGKDEAVTLACQYPRFQDAWHVGQKHPFRLLVQQLDKVRVEMSNPASMLEQQRVLNRLRSGVQEYDHRVEMDRLQRIIDENDERDQSEVQERRALEDYEKR